MFGALSFAESQALSALNCFPGGFSAKLFAQCGKASCYRVAASWRCRNATHGENSNGVA
jgi:hypothetical protein